MTFVCDALVDTGRQALVLAAADGDDGRLRSLLRAAGVEHARTAAGTAVRVPGPHAARLLALDGAEIRWTSEARRFAEARRQAGRSNHRLRQLVDRLPDMGRDELAALVAELDDADRLDLHQLRNVVAMTRPGTDGLAVFDEQGAGKTVTGIYALDVLFARDEIGLALIVAPKSMVAEWPPEIARFRPGAYVVSVLDGDRRRKLRQLREDADVVVCNFETVAALEQQLTARVRRYDGRVALLVDESFLVKNRDAIRAQALRRLREWCGRCFVLCGTPAPNSAIDLVAQVDLVDFGDTFAGVTVPDDRDGAHQVVLDTLRDRGVYLRSTKDAVLPDLPARSFDLVPVTLAGQQAAAYRHALRDLIVDLRAEDDAGFARHLTSWAARRAALLQICSNPGRVVYGYAEEPAKLTALDRLLDHLVVDQGEKVVVWSFYTASLEAICDRYAHLGVVRYDGTVTDAAARREAVRSFQEDPGTRVFVANPAAAGAGLTLHAARTAIYESFSNQAAHFMQSVDRIHRRGQTREVRYVVLLAEGTLEEREYARLVGKQEAARELLGDPGDPPPTRQAMLDEILDVASRVGVAALEPAP